MWSACRRASTHSPISRLATEEVLPPMWRVLPASTRTARARHARHAAQLGEGILQAVAEALEALGEADAAGLPVRVGQHEVVDQVRKRLAVDRHLQAAGVREIGGAQVAGLVDLAEEHLLGR